MLSVSLSTCNSEFIGVLAHLRYKGKERVNTYSKGLLVLKCFIVHFKEQAFNLRRLTGLVYLYFKRYFWCY